jgi:hypothetical protein
MIVLTALFALSSPVLAQMGNNQGNNMMGGDSWGSKWGMGYGCFGWVIVIIVAVLVILGVVYMIKRK